MTVEAPFPNMNWMEGVRAVLAIVGFAAAFWGLAHATDGMMAFASPIRARMVKRRHWQMGGALVMFAALGIQTAIVATTPDNYPLSLAAVTGNVALIITLGVLLFLTLQQALGWVSFEEILGKTPLVPPPDAYVSETSLMSRTIVHAINNDLGLLVGEADILAADPTLTLTQRASVMRQVDYAAAITRRMVDVQQLIRSLSPETPPRSEGAA